MSEPVLIALITALGSSTITVIGNIIIEVIRGKRALKNDTNNSNSNDQEQDDGTITWVIPSRNNYETFTRINPKEIVRRALFVGLAFGFSVFSFLLLVNTYSQTSQEKLAKIQFIITENGRSIPIECDTVWHMHTEYGIDIEALAINQDGTIYAGELHFEYTIPNSTGIVFEERIIKNYTTTRDNLVTVLIIEQSTNFLKSCVIRIDT